MSNPIIDEWTSPNGDVRLILGDCLRVIETLEPADLLLADPPYEMEMGSGGGCFGMDKRTYLKDISGFTDGGFDETILERAENWMCFCSKAQLPSLLQRAAAMPRWMLLTWNKPNPTPLCNGNYLPDTEYIVHGFQPKRIFGEFADKSRFIVYPSQQHNLHPNEKPLAVVGKLMRLGTKVGDLVLDPYMGSGTTGVACVRTGRRFIGIEIERKYYETAKQRIQAEIGRFPLFERAESENQRGLFE